ncbi:MAG: plasmid stabilization protein [Verrucomicrobia bacterium]|jgi:mRNA-degrading endonuclease YafQ of YafQ-DinJ toxin-antitoxin module|nr:plasmid stabilization protein [Verrucomicrobiota bacterium]MBT7700086.1 plasmid stabilization protein [Verrucomicrobiota bacterium]
MNTLVWTNTFSRTARKFLRKHPDLRPEFDRVLKQLEKDPSHPKLRLHPLKGRLAGKHAVSLTYSHRIVLVLILDRDEILLLDVGTHDQAYRA